LAENYVQAAASATRLGKYSLANQYAEEAVNLKPTALNLAFLCQTLQMFAVDKFNSNDFAGALQLARKATNVGQSCKKAEDFTPNLISVAEIAANYRLAADCAHRVKRDDLTREFLEDALKIEPTAKDYALLFVTLHNLTVPKFNNKDFLGALEMVRKSINAYESYKAAKDYEPNLIPPSEVGGNFAFAAIIATYLRKFDEAYGYAEKSVNSDPSFWNQAVYMAALYNIGRKDEAKAMLEKKVKQNPNQTWFIELANEIKTRPNAEYWILQFGPLKE